MPAWARPVLSGGSRSAARSVRLSPPGRRHPSHPCGAQDGDDGLDPELLAVGVDESQLFLMLVVDLCAEASGRSFQNFVGAPKFSCLLFKFLDALGFRGGHLRRMPVVDVGLTHLGAHRLHLVARLRSDPRDRALLGPPLGRQGWNHPYGSSLFLQAVSTRRGLPRRLFFRPTCILVSRVRGPLGFPG